MRKITALAAVLAAAALASPALAGSAEGRWQVKLLGTGVLVDGKITQVDKDTVGLPGGSQTDINDNVVPTVAIEYYATPHLSIETICCLTQHHASGAGALPSGAGIVDHIMILPATVTVKYHFDAGPVKPYVGVGPSVFFFIDEKPGAVAATFANRVHLDNRAGVALQAGLDIPVNDRGMGVSLDAKKYFIGTKAHFSNAAGTEVLTTEHKLDPWVVSGGLYLRF
ncbi:MAG: OmpW/AlkL family protein [Novosphingobium sp.]